MTKDKVKVAFEKLKGDFGYKNRLQAPRIQKVVVSVGTGSKMKLDRNKNDFIVERITAITGQKPVVRKAKQSIAGFKIRTGDPIGVTVTLRGEKMYAFIDKLIHVALPRTKDFRGVNPGSVDDIGNVSLGIKENTIFPETGNEELKDVFGMAVTIVTTAKNKEEAKAFFDYLGIPFRKK